MSRQCRRPGASLILAVAVMLALCPFYWDRPSSGFAGINPVDRAATVARQSDKVDKIVESLKELTLLEASELVSAIEETFGVDASASAGAVMMAAPGGGGAGEEEEKAPEKTEFDIILKEVPKDKKIAILKVVRGITGMGLKDAKGIVDNPGKFIEGKPKDYCEDAKKQLEEAGASVELV
mmetsp:Transcript_19650/g.34821  ORF Transcript_19650/g.34821 Transcript_19650/m.34821 type:complete len:180 (+) Transcript_19650:107-646(+)|eukprot:CAMPEP_0197664942 /NCGR_PEP_ID=MMETSP1338-20131121/58944_1 /TAXON_ID=43686 ORGANISM="Pelagodinium beii, Strain RCC1491" /NCGR_SAMPLE_ID=MMETSP1338 /ASSEMBLY_ACC=CAM_ASM_000754 /LENGTH=179 /DNA_ID=CAMNT_0043243679 /DNA_START=106 /DNA_END=645 /DNA_ORIENTATION=-